MILINLDDEVHEEFDPHGLRHISDPRHMETISRDQIQHRIHSGGQKVSSSSPRRQNEGGRGRPLSR